MKNETFRGIVRQSDDRVRVHLSGFPRDAEVRVKMALHVPVFPPQRRGHRIMTPKSFPFPILLQQQREFPPSQSLVLIPPLLHRMPPPNMFSSCPGMSLYDGVVSPKKECQRARDGRAGVRGCRDTDDAPGGGDGGERRDARDESQVAREAVVALADSMKKSW
jgi:hypothetical protein